ncbi:MAG: hypothetical protein PHC61_12290 [Chitinivibrionales bacterium]|nr:hypothetical protein [Chitinivibrionales bacterium]
MKRIAVIMLLSWLMCVPLWAAAPQMTYQEYETTLAGMQQREKESKEQIAQEQAKIESVKQQMEETDRRIAAVLAETYAILGITENDVFAAETEIGAIKQELSSLQALSPEDLAKRKADIKKIEARIAELKRKPAALLRRVAEQIPELDQMVAQLKTNLSTRVAAAGNTGTSNSYTVRLIPGNRDCLYRIAQYDFIYGDPAQWPRIYTANKDVIDKKYDRYVKKTGDTKYTRSQDLLLPGQVLDIPR